MLGPQDVGHRVVVRRIVGIRGNRPLFTDVLGELIDYGSTSLTVATKQGMQHIPLDATRLPATVIDDLKALLAEHPGESHVVLEVQTTAGVRKLRLGDGFKVARSKLLLSELQSLTAANGVAREPIPAVV